MSHAPVLHPTDYFGPVIGAVVFTALMALLREPTRRTFNAIFVAGAAGVYLSGGFGLWELPFPAPIALWFLAGAPGRGARAT